MPDLPTLLQSIRADPDDKPQWLALSWWLWAGGREDEAAVVRVFWPTLRDHMTQDGWSLEATVADVAENAKVLGDAAPEIERRDKSAGPAGPT
jgi:hypothetical protein